MYELVLYNMFVLFILYFRINTVVNLITLMFAAKNSPILNCKTVKWNFKDLKGATLHNHTAETVGQNSLKLN